MRKEMSPGRSGHTGKTVVSDQWSVGGRDFALEVALKQKRTLCIFESYFFLQS